MQTTAMLVLLIEDCEETRRLYERVLTAGGYRVAVAADGLEGAMKAEQLRPDLVVTDLDMPVLDGLEVATRIRRSKRTAATRIIVLTGFGMRRCIRRAFEVGCDAFLVKPCRPQELLDAVEQCLSDRPRTATKQPFTRTV